METAVRHKYKFTVDEDHFESEQERLTPTEIMMLAHIDPASHYLIAIHGHDQISYKDKPNEPIDLKEYHKFISNSTGPTTVS